MEEVRFSVLLSLGLNLGQRTRKSQAQPCLELRGPVMSCGRLWQREQTRPAVRSQSSWAPGRCTLPYSGERLEACLDIDVKGMTGCFTPYRGEQGQRHRIEFCRSSSGFVGLPWACRPIVTGTGGQESECNLRCWPCLFVVVDGVLHWPET